jgi:hypothetical protein
MPSFLIEITARILAWELTNILFFSLQPSTCNSLAVSAEDLSWNKGPTSYLMECPAVHVIFLAYGCF